MAQWHRMKKLGMAGERTTTKFPAPKTERESMQPAPITSTVAFATLYSPTIGDTADRFALAPLPVLTTTRYVKQFCLRPSVDP